MVTVAKLEQWIAEIETRITREEARGALDPTLLGDLQDQLRFCRLWRLRLSKAGAAGVVRASGP